MTNNKRIGLFLAASFISGVGDTLLTFAVPVGLGLQTKDMSAAVLMWLIPAIAVYFSSFLHRHVANKQSSARKNYAAIVLGVAVLEIIVAILALRSDLQNHIVVLISVFIFGYAFIKEGIPRLLYVVSVYNYFGDSKSYTRIAGLNAGLNVLAAFTGTLISAYVVARGSWKFALLIDAITFVVLGAALLLAGRDPEPASSGNNESDPENATLPQSGVFKWILLSVTLLPIANSMVGNYLPLLVEKFSVSTAATGIVAIALLRLPGMLAGLNLVSLTKRIPPELLVKAIPLANLSVSIAFVLFPSTLGLCLLVLIQGFATGVYWPVDYTQRNNLPHMQLVRFNTFALRRLAVFQALACIGAILLFRLNANLALWIPSIIAILTAMSWLSLKWYLSQKLSSWVSNLAVASVAACGFGTVIFANHTPATDDVYVVLPSVSQDLRLRNDLTFSSFAILNDSSAHLVRVTNDLSLKPEVIKSFERLENGRRYLIHIDELYQSSRGEHVDSEDVAFTIKFYLSQHRDIAGVLTSIEGAENCIKGPTECNLPSIQVLSSTTLSVTLAKPDIKFIEKLSSPWLMVFKREKPLEEHIGTCILPQQLGHAQVTACDPSFVQMTFGDQIVKVTKSVPRGFENAAKSIINDNPGLPANPTLTILTAFANPNSRVLSDGLRISLISTLRSKTKTIRVSP